MTNIFDADPNAFVEPWTPRVGDRVRIGRLAECRALLPPVCNGRRAGFDLMHIEGEEGMTGTVEDLLRAFHKHNFNHCVANGHIYSVEYDRPIQTGVRRWMDGQFAACELELLP